MNPDSDHLAPRMKHVWLFCFGFIHTHAILALHNECLGPSGWIGDLIGAMMMGLSSD